MESSKPYLAQVHCVATFSVDKEIRHRSREIEQAFHAVLAAQATSTNVPDSMVDSIPRFVMQGGPKKISISQTTAQLDLSFDDKSKPLENSFKTLQKNSDLFWKGICQLIPINNRKDYGVIVAINFPSSMEPTSNLARAIYERFLKGPSFGDVASCTIQLGFLSPEKKIFRNFSIGSYEIRKGRIDHSLPANFSPQVIDIQNLEVVETGYEVKMDINSKPKVMDKIPLSEDHGHVVIQELEKFIFSDGAELLNW